MRAVRDVPGRHALAGESWTQGQVVVSWEDAVEGAAIVNDLTPGPDDIVIEGKRGLPRHRHCLGIAVPRSSPAGTAT